MKIVLFPEVSQSTFQKSINFQRPY